jgi:UPF0755 protein
MAYLKKLFVFCTLLLLLSFAGGAWLFIRWIDEPILSTSLEKKTEGGVIGTGISSKSIDFTIKPGSSIRSASRQLVAAGIPIQSYLFEALARVMGKANSLKAGSFELQSQDTPRDLLRKIVDGKFSFANLGIIEGWSFKQMRSAIDAHPSLRHDTTGMSNKDLLVKIGSKFTHPEGAFFPDTYLFAKNSSDLQVYQQAHQALLMHLDEAWKKRAENMPYKDSYQALIMASIVEKETGQSAERALIASVFVNRLRVGMLLQTDPTVIYGMGDKFQGNIRKADLLKDTPYNTYTRAGLPPTPIALPGMASLNAALNPEPSKAYYFVARGNGTSHFSETLNEHNNAVNKYQR